MKNQSSYLQDQSKPPRIDQMKIHQKRRGFGLNEVIGIAAGIIIAVVVVIPGLQTFAGSVLSQLTNWWNSMAAGIFTS